MSSNAEMTQWERQKNILSSIKDQQQGLKKLVNN